MNERLTIQDLIDLLAAKHSMTKKVCRSKSSKSLSLLDRTSPGELRRLRKSKDSWDFQTCGCSIVGKALMSKHRGTFPNKRSYQSIVYSGHQSEQIATNKPFAHFETVVLNEGTVLEDTPNGRIR